MARPDLKSEDENVRPIEERIRDAADRFGLKQEHVDRLVDHGIECLLFKLWDRVDDVERRVAALEG